MTKVITYGTYDLLHYGHIRLLERAKALGDYLIVGVTADNFDIARGKINVQQSLLERVEAVRKTGIADEIIVEEYEGQKIDDILKYDVDIFTVGSDWAGKFDYLNEYCKVVYLDRTQGISSSKIRSTESELRIGVVGESIIINKFVKECRYVNGVQPVGLYSTNTNMDVKGIEGLKVYDTYESLVEGCDAIYIASHPSKHYTQIKYALQHNKHVIYESVLTTDYDEAIELLELAEERGCILYAGIKTAYSTAYSRMILMAKTGKIGKIMSVDATCTSLKDIDYNDKSVLSHTWNSICDWGPTAMLPVFQLLGIDYEAANLWSCIAEGTKYYDLFTKIDFRYNDCTASIKVGKGVKSEGELVISGTEGYIIVPSPWWKTDYFEIRYECQDMNKRFFYQLEGEGIRNMILSFVQSIRSNKISYISKDIILATSKLLTSYYRCDTSPIRMSTIENL